MRCECLYWRKKLIMWESHWHCMKKIGKNLVVLLWWMVGLIKRHRALINFLVNSPNCFSRVYGCLKSTQILVKKCVNLLIKCAACWLRECGPNCFSGVCGCLRVHKYWLKKCVSLLIKCATCWLRKCGANCDRQC